MTLHTCSYTCSKPECIKARRDELRANSAEIRRYHKACEMALEALLDDCLVQVGPHSWERRSDLAIEALREILGEKK